MGGAGQIQRQIPSDDGNKIILTDLGGVPTLCTVDTTTTMDFFFFHLGNRPSVCYPRTVLILRGDVILRGPILFPPKVDNSFRYGAMLWPL